MADNFVLRTKANAFDDETLRKKRLEASQRAAGAQVQESLAPSLAAGAAQPSVSTAVSAAPITERLSLQDARNVRPAQATLASTVLPSSAPAPLSTAATGNAAQQTPQVSAVQGLQSGTSLRGQAVTPNIRGKVRRGETLTNADAQATGFRGTELDSGAFREQASAFFKAQDDRKQSEALNALRQRVIKGGFGSSRAAESLAELQGQETQAKGLKGLLDVQKLALKQQGQQFDQTLAGNKAGSGFLDSFLSRQDPEVFPTAGEDGASAAGRTQFLSELAGSFNSETDVANASAIYDGLVRINQDIGNLNFDAFDSVNSLSQFQDLRIEGDEVAFTTPGGKKFRDSIGGVFGANVNADQLASLFQRLGIGQAK